jgi:hypothetical protein
MALSRCTHVTRLSSGCLDPPQAPPPFFPRARYRLQPPPHGTHNVTTYLWRTRGYVVEWSARYGLGARPPVPGSSICERVGTQRIVETAAGSPWCVHCCCRCRWLLSEAGVDETHMPELLLKKRAIRGSPTLPPTCRAQETNSPPPSPSSSFASPRVTLHLAQHLLSHSGVQGGSQGGPLVVTATVWVQ